MKKSIRPVSVAAFLAAVTLLSAAYVQAEDSGYLGDYSVLSETTDATGDKVRRYVNPKFKPGAYQSVIIDPTQFYPTPQPTGQVTAGTLNDISAYVDRGLRNKLGAKMTLASQPGPGVLRIKPAITAVSAQTVGLKPYQLIPVAFLVSSVAGRDKEAAVQIEVDVVDSMTGERMGAAVREGVGAKLPNKDARLLLDDLRPLLDKWIDTGSTFVAQRME